MSSWNFSIYLLIWQEQIQKLPLFFFLLWLCWFLVRRGVFIFHNFLYFHLDLIFFKYIIFVPISFFSYNLIIFLFISYNSTQCY